MSTQIKWLPLSIAGVLVIIAIVALASSIFADEIFPEYSPSHRGFLVAVDAGCFSCHSGASNPSAENSSDTVPLLSEDRHSPDELRQWIEDGITKEKAESKSYLEARDAKALKMPAYKDRLSGNEIEDLIAYLALFQYTPARTEKTTGSKGEQLARKYSCFTCHGELGQGGIENPRSLKGYIPGFFGTDFRALTQNGNREDIREWILEGRSRFFWDQGFAGIFPGRYFTNRQAIQMPAYEGIIPENEVEVLVDYLIETMDKGPLTSEDIFHMESIIPGKEAETSARTDLNPKDLASAGFKIIEEHCMDCHGPEKQRSRYRLDSREEAVEGGEISDFLSRPALVPMKANESLLIQYVEATEEIPSEEIYPMPPGKRPKLTEEQKTILRAWIDTGFEWPE